jgi:nitrogen fixation-related uncharacterized protein
MAVLVLILPIVILALLAVAAQAWGVDSRDESTDPRSPDRGLATH